MSLQSNNGPLNSVLSKIRQSLLSVWKFSQKPVTIKTILPVSSRLHSSSASSFSVTDEEQLFACLLKSGWSPASALPYEGLIGGFRRVFYNVLPFLKWMKFFVLRAYALLLVLQFPAGLMKNLLKKQLTVQLKFYGKRLFALLLILGALGGFVLLYQIHLYLQKTGLKLDSLGEQVFISALFVMAVLLAGSILLSKWLRKREEKYLSVLLSYREIIRLRSGVRRRIQVDGDITHENIQAFQNFLQKKQAFMLEQPDKITLQLAKQYAETWDLERLKVVLESGVYSSEVAKLLNSWPKVNFQLKPNPKLKDQFYEDVVNVIRSGIEDCIDQELSYCEKMDDPRSWSEFLADSKAAAHRLGHPLPQGYEHVIRDFFATHDLPKPAIKLLGLLGISSSEASMQPRVFMGLLRRAT